MDIHVSLDNNMKIDKKLFTKMNFIYNAIEDGWTVSKRRDKYVFTRSHDKRREILSDDYLSAFIKSNLALNTNK
jgi:hypothetical protein